MQFNLAGLKDLVKDLGEKPYRGLQLAEWIYLRGATSFEEMNNMPGRLRLILDERFVLSRPRVLRKVGARDGTTRYLIALSDEQRTETVALPSKKRLTVCFSTQVGCAFACTFCATGSMGLSRSLLPGEMLAQVALVASEHPNTRISNIVAMGQGEPFANYAATLSALRMMNEPRLFGVGARHITVSTAGLVQQVRQFTEEPEQFTLAVSLHSADQKVRDFLMPGLIG